MEKQSAMNLFARLDQLNRIGAALSRERNIERLLENILEAAKALTGADGGTLYSVTEDGTPSPVPGALTPCGKRGQRTIGECWNP